MKKSLVLAMAMALGVTASAYAANPFSDVPAGHWAYDSINKLAAAGVIEGYGDSTFGGDKLMTRYEMAQIVAKAMAKGANVDKLAAEFADELDNLGVRVANLEKKADNVKITGETRYRYWDNDTDTAKSNGSTDALRTRIWVTGAINDDWSYKGMLENIQNFEKSNSGEETTKFQRAYVTGKLGGLAVTAGRYGFTDFTGGNIYDTRMDGGQVAYGKDVKLTLGAGKAADAYPAKTAVNEGSKADTMYYANLAGKIGVVDANASYYKFDNVSKLASGAEDDKIWTVGVAFPVLKDLKLGATYLASDYDRNNVDDDGYVVTLDYKGAKAAKAGSWGIFAKYYDQGVGTYIAHTMNGQCGDFVDTDNGFKGYQVGANYTFAKNIVGQVEYYDLEAKTGSKEAKTFYGQVNFQF